MKNILKTVFCLAIMLAVFAVGSVYADVVTGPRIDNKVDSTKGEVNGSSQVSVRVGTIEVPVVDFTVSWNDMIFNYVYDNETDSMVWAQDGVDFKIVNNNPYACDVNFETNFAIADKTGMYKDTEGVFSYYNEIGEKVVYSRNQYFMYSGVPISETMDFTTMLPEEAGIENCEGTSCKVEYNLNLQLNQRSPMYSAPNENDIIGYLNILAYSRYYFG